MDQPALARLGRAALPIVALLVFGVVVGASVVAAGDKLGFDFLAYHQAAVRLLERPAAVRHELPDDRRLRALLLPADVRAADPAVRAAVGDDGRLGLDGDPDRVIRRGRRGPAGQPHRALVDRPAGRPVVAVRLRGQARPGRAGPVPAVRDRLALARRPDPARRERGARHGDQAPAGDHLRLGDPDPTLGGGRGGRRRPGGAWPSPRRCWPARAPGRISRCSSDRSATRSPPSTTSRPVRSPTRWGCRRSSPRCSSSRARCWSWRRSSRPRAGRPRRPSYLVAVIASQLLSPILWDHYAMLLLLPVAYLCAAGRWWAVLIPLATAVPLIGITPAVVYPLAFAVALGATLGGRDPARARRSP